MITKLWEGEGSEIAEIVMTSFWYGPQVSRKMDIVIEGYQKLEDKLAQEMS